MKPHIIFALIIITSLTAGAASATLIDRGDLLVYDTDLDITWLADPNYAFNSGSDPNGLMTWQEANQWAGQLSYAGFTEWRLPVTPEIDPNCTYLNAAQNKSWGQSCSGSEMGHLYFIETQTDTNGWHIRNPNTDLFLPLVSSEKYWSSSEDSTNIFGHTAYVFAFFNGFQSIQGKNSNYAAWAVHDGDIGAPIPEPSILTLIGLGFVGLSVLRRRKTSQRRIKTKPSQSF